MIKIINLFIVKKFIIWMFLYLIFLTWSSAAQAHTDIHPQSGWIYGFMHPTSGLDHILAMIAVGLWATQLGNRAIWLVPLTFVSIMGLGGLLGIGDLPFAYAEHGIIFSLLVMGILIAAAIRLPLIASIILIAIFALCHGYAHGNEMPQNISVSSYGAGFMLATAILHAVGSGIALISKSIGASQWLRIAGIAIMLYGSFLFAG